MGLDFFPPFVGEGKFYHECFYADQSIRWGAFCSSAAMRGRTGPTTIFRNFFQNTCLVFPMKPLSLINPHIDKYKFIWFVTSPYMSSKTLLLFRTIVMGWSTAVLAFSLIYNLAIQKQSVYDWIDQFPHLAWIGLVLYFLVIF